MHNNARQRQKHERERDEQEEDGHSPFAFVGAFRLRLYFIHEHNIVDDHEIAEEHHAERHDVVDDQVDFLPLGENVIAVVFALVTDDRLRRR